jgi:murein DD-endopeptidase MepM/ murein hydrolase activator NlpD
MALLLVAPLIFGVAAPAQVSGDNLASVQAQQRALQQKIAAQKAEVARLQAMQASLTADMASTNRALGGINANLAQTKQEIASLATEIAAVRAVYTDLVAQVSSLDAEVVSLNQQQAEKAQELADRKAMLAARLVEAYRTDRTPLVQQLLTAGTIADVVQDVGSYLDFGSQDEAIAQQITQDQQTLNALTATTVQARAAADDLRSQTLAQKQHLDAQMTALGAAKTRLAKLQAQTSQQLAIQRAGWAKVSKNAADVKAELAAEAKAQAELAARVAALLAQQRQFGNIPSVYNGSLEWPISGVITQEFGCTGFPSEPPLGDCAHFHQGIDIAAPMYTPIHAAGDGVVLFAGPNPYDPYPKAWIVIIAHSDSLVTWYAHVDNGPLPPVVAAGDHVKQGQVIAYVGMTGRTTGPHLHWAVVYNNQFVNPRLFV